MVPKRISNKRNMSEALTNMSWIKDILGVAIPKLMAELLRLWDLVTHVVLLLGILDVHNWRPSSSGQYTAKSAYETFFQGSIQFESRECI
ncbi:hypothetical protein PR202_ga08048 [Eleusine coracana subsp. coracana]|uniref:Uncharacterized protein n=1 Tax=Eleusine coracana subsp. coracana TaxID=191504 RepID=A0AAV5BZA8_ELECO|nr:hypothetical protein PR202_ga08048 [Eleusine coracana subsp. coracana]